ncbi:hypothetical protein AB0P17_15340 [Streptomyces sp. NPDC088124]|uniref:hypothetical protein n=1 Tax=Streptomyces sp. NPDC088124 TaxID=3154654 RepID=UPI003430FA34
MKTTAKKKTPAAASPAQQTWNHGRVGAPVPGQVLAAPGSCTTERCGEVADSMDESAASLRGWVRAGVYGSTEPDRVWCSGQCAAYGIALAELRVTGGRAL